MSIIACLSAHNIQTSLIVIGTVIQYFYEYNDWSVIYWCEFM